MQRPKLWEFRIFCLATFDTHCARETLQASVEIKAETARLVLNFEQVKAVPAPTNYQNGFLFTGLLRTPGVAVYYGNGRELARWENPRIGIRPEILMFTLPTGGWDNDELDETKLPADFTIDYVRVWQRTDLASPGDGQKP